jgi:hypothetical protein
VGVSVKEAKWKMLCTDEIGPQAGAGKLRDEENAAPRRAAPTDDETDLTFRSKCHRERE